MAYPVNVAGFENQKLEMNVNMWTGAQLFINGVKAPKGPRRGQMLLTRDDGREVLASWKAQGLGFDIPQLVVDGEAFKLVEPLPWYQWVWSGVPVALVFVGGALGAIIGLIALSINASLFRSRMNEFMKYVVTGLVSAVAILIDLLIATALTAAIR